MEEFEFVLQEPEGTADFDQPIPDDTMCVATVMKTEKVERTFPSEPQPVTRLKWKFRIDEPEDYRDRYVTGESGVKFVNHPSCRILTWAQATLGINPLPPSYGFNQPDLWNRQVRVLVATRVGKDKTTGEERTYNYVEDVLPLNASVAAGPFDDDTFVVDAATWWPDVRLGSPPERMLPPKSQRPSKFAIPDRVIARVWEGVDCGDPDECWEWTRSIGSHGYGQIGWKDTATGVTTMTTAHRVAWLASGGVIPPGYVIDHRCRNRRCCNPAHLRPRTNPENAADNTHTLKPECPAGHPYDDENTHLTPKGHRRCCTCARERMRVQRR